MLYQMDGHHPLNLCPVKKYSPSGSTCAETGNRTQDTTIFSRVLYQLSYLGNRFVFYLPKGDVSRNFPFSVGLLHR